MRVWSFATVLIIVIVVALGWFLGVSPKLAEAARFDSERLAVQGQNEVTRALIAQLEADFENIDELRDELALLRAQFPTQAEYDSAVEEFVTAVLTQGLILQNLQINEPSPTSASVLGPDEVAPEPEIDGEGVLPSGSLLLVSTSVTVFGPLDATLAFIDALQRSPRFGIVPTWTFNAEGGAGGETTITLHIYVVSGQDLVDVDPVESVEPSTDPSSEATPEPTTEPSPATTDVPASTPEPTPTP
jgi:hypothetical protein